MHLIKDVNNKLSSGLALHIHLFPLSQVQKLLDNLKVRIYGTFPWQILKYHREYKFTPPLS